MDDIFSSDIRSFPQQDPEILKKIQAEQEKAEKREAEERKKDQAMAKKAAAMPKVTKKEEKKEPVVHDSLVAMKIRLYHEKLGHKLSSKMPKTLPSDPQQLKEMLAQIEGELHSAGGIEKASAVYIQLGVVLEKTNQQYNPFGLQLSGPKASFAETLAANRAQWQDLVTEFAISNAKWFMTGPLTRLIVATGEIMMAVDMANKSAQPRPASKEQLKEKDDL